MLVQTSDALSGFFMHRVALAPLAVLLQLDTIRIVLLVLLGRVVTALALRARQSDQSTHEFSFYRLLPSLWHIHMKSLLAEEEARMRGLPASTGRFT